MSEPWQPLSDQISAQLRREPAVADAIAGLRRAGVRPRVGVSACLLGAPVRYDGDHREAPAMTALLAAWLELVPLCPEVAIGMGVPRPPIQRVRLPDGGELVRGVHDPALEVSAALDRYAAEIAAGPALHGYVFKARSPSCAPGSAPVFDAQDRLLGQGWGRYAGQLRAAWPLLPMCDEEALLTEQQCADFVLACYRQLLR